MGELTNGASHPTSSRLSWQRVLPDLVSMNDQPFSDGSASVGVGAAVGVPRGDVGGGIDRVGRGVEKLGSVGLAASCFGWPGTVDWQPASSTPAASRLAVISRA